MNNVFHWIALTALYLSYIRACGYEDTPERRRAWLELNFLWEGDA